jgi:hypothetical protein
MKVLLCRPRGFCAGVERAIETVERALHKYGRPVAHPVLGSSSAAAGQFALGQGAVIELH